MSCSLRLLIKNMLCFIGVCIWGSVLNIWMNGAPREYYYFSWNTNWRNIWIIETDTLKTAQFIRSISRKSYYPAESTSMMQNCQSGELFHDIPNPSNNILVLPWWIYWVLMLLHTVVLQSMSSSPLKSSGAFSIHHLDDCKSLFNGASPRNGLHLHESMKF